MSTKMRSFNSPKSLYKKICKGLMIDGKLRMKGLVYKIIYKDFEGRELLYENKSTNSKLEIYHIDRFQDYKKLFGVFITDEAGAFIDGYGPEQNPTKPLTF